MRIQPCFCLSSEWQGKPYSAPRSSVVERRPWTVFVFESWPLPLSNLSSLSLCFLFCKRERVIPNLEHCHGDLPGLRKRMQCVYGIWFQVWYIIGAQCFVAVIVVYVLCLCMFCTLQSTFIQIFPAIIKGRSILLNVRKWGLSKLTRATGCLEEIHGTELPGTGAVFVWWIGKWVWQESGSRADKNYALWDQAEYAINKVRSWSLPESL